MRSVSSLVEAYLDRIWAHTETSSNIQAPITGSLIGMFADQDQGQDDKTLLSEVCMEKHKWASGYLLILMWFWMCL